ncbi:flavin monoamine oxidase family protein [Nocardia camponoti]|uniref:Putrescine oxidase n=1 Tax=Nocardia camponoti TaxID=1616106 RepID=A0A917QDB0_9NOCA|nr:NAD(P)/FAD-dependent oxidoreductase [Nocardia camponoti]GGK44556.1 putative putrescine oxidase [Nocardia camponoti]
MPAFTRDVAIIGAGLSGLTAATELRKAGVSVVVVEARDRVGGRTWTGDIDGAMIEIGGQWLSPHHTAALDLVKELGLETFSRHRIGESIYLAADGERHLFTGDVFPAPAATTKEIQRLLTLLDTLAAEVGADQPWAHPRAAELDAVPFPLWLARESDDEYARETVAFYVSGAMLTKPAHTLSTLQALHMAAAQGSYTNLATDTFMLDKRVVGGMQQVSQRLAASLGDDVVLNAPVRRMEWSDEGVTVIADGDLEVRADQAILAIPPTLYPSISFAPPLPRLRNQMYQHMSFGFVVKIHAVYDKPFWRAKGLSGTGFSDTDLLSEIYDNTNYDADNGALVGFIVNEQADAYFAMDADARKEAALASFVRYLGPEAANPTVFYESDWGAEEFTGGAYGVSFDFGGLTRYGASLRTPLGPIHFACSDLAGQGFQHIDGAVRMGRRAAEEIVERRKASVL